VVSLEHADNRPPHTQYPITTFHTSYLAAWFRLPIIAYSSIPKATKKAPIRLVPPTMTLPPAPLELEGDGDVEVVLAVLVAALLVVVVRVLFG
jgi:hypothetical protein